MRIAQLDPDPIILRRQGEELQRLLAQPTAAQRRPCPGCNLPCPCAGSRSCTCGCAPDCDHAPRMMTSDPKYPIESAIAPLVYALYSLRLCDPCWSCEGHCAASGRLIKIPRVWFYARSLVYPRLIDEYLVILRHHRRLRHPWHLCVTYSAIDNADTAFSVEPDLTFIADARLRDLHRDVAAIAEGLADAVRAGARHHLDRAMDFAASAAAAPGRHGRGVRRRR